MEEREDLVYVAVIDCELKDQLWSNIFCRPIRSERKQPIRSELKQPIRSEFKQPIGSSDGNRISQDAGSIKEDRDSLVSSDTYIALGLIENSNSTIL